MGSESLKGYICSRRKLVRRRSWKRKGFYFQMEGFAGGRIQTAARAHGVM
ncbi:hypothetical protein LEP1GSC065_0011 [Leptospira kirschneri serovar Sokoine str. RM1]|nr:hypothetical protein LEP1GSC065_0011 [Leptospira kirschneri serovar Sokoine str. RM1]